MMKERKENEAAPLRTVVGLLREQISGGTVNAEEVSRAITWLGIESDRLRCQGLPAGDIEYLRETLLWLRTEVLEP